MKRVDGYIERVKTAERQAARDINAIRLDALVDEVLSDIERAAFGLTGSLEALERYQDLAQSIGDLAGKPMIVFNPTNVGKGVVDANGGILTGKTHVNFTYSRGEPSVPSNIVGADFYADVLPLISYTRVPSTGITEIHVNSPFYGYDEASGLGGILISSLEPTRNTGLVGQMIPDEISHGTVLLDRTQIQESEFFHRGLDETLRRIEEER
jgi:hypothetical protein